MSSELLPEEKIFQAARRIESEDERCAFLERECGDDEDLRRRVDRLLEAFESSDSFLESPASELTTDLRATDRPIAEGPGDTIGTYKLLQQIGEGGMGVVYMADQTEPIARRVALKIIKPGMDTRQVIARFEAERQALAMMDHPHIAMVIEAGATDTGRPYFVMELVKGIPITDYCDQHQLTPRERLELFLPVCHAIQHAHQKGIIHRDIKPSNVLVANYDDQAIPKIIDFGVAKAIQHRLTDKTMFTEFGQVVGTVDYMSPEQAKLNNWDVDTRSDVYSLGVLLYELLAGETPFDRERLRSAAFDELLRIIHEEEPPCPSMRVSTSKALPTIAANRHTDAQKLSTLVRGELDWIVMKAVEKDRTRRYETASSFAEDVQLYLRGEAVKACPPSASYRFKKFARRNKRILATLAVIGFVLVAASVFSTYQAIRATRAEQVALESLNDANQARDEAGSQRRRAEQQAGQAEAARSRESDQRARAEANFQKAREAVDRYFTLVSENTLLDRPDLEGLRQQLLDAALEYYQQFTDQRADDPTLRAELVAAHFRIAQLANAMGRQEWLPSVEQGIAIAQQLADEDFDVSQNPVWCEGIVTVSLDNKLRQSNPGVVPVFQNGIDVWEQFVERYPNIAGIQNDLATMYLVAGASHDNPLAALASYNKALAIFEKLVREHPNNSNYRLRLGVLLHELAYGLRGIGSQKQAEQYWRRAINVLERLHADFPDSPIYKNGLAESRHGLARLLADQGSSPEAEQLWDLAIAARRELVEQFPNVARYWNRLNSSYKFLGRYHTDHGRHEDAAATLRLRFDALSNAIAFAREYPNSNLDQSELLYWKQELLTAVAASRDQKAINEVLPQLGELITEFGNDGNSRVLNDLAWRMVVSADIDDKIAEASMRLAVRACELQPRTASYWNTLGVAQYRNEEYTTAIDSLQRSRTVDYCWRPSLPAADCYFLAMAHAKLGHAELAEKWFRAADLWMALFAVTDNELKGFRQEAVEVVGVEAEPLTSVPLNRETEQELLRLCVAADPQRGWVHHWMGARLAERSAWSEADEQLTQAAASLTENQWALFRHALVRLKLSDLEGYRRACSTLCERFGQVEDPLESNTVAWTCGLAADALGDMSVPLAHAQKCVELEPQNPTYSCTLGLLLFRCGQYEDAASQFATSISALESHNDSRFTVIYPRILLAMAHWKLGHKDEARKMQSQARSRLELERPEDMSWHRRATVELLLAQAEQMIPSDD